MVGEARENQKREYQTPQLAVFGTLRELTAGGGGTNREPGGGSAPKSKATGTTA
jgi:hypothetical protein